jgi:hypothetical protein
LRSGRTARGSEGKSTTEVVTTSASGELSVSGIHNPSITPYLPSKDKATGLAILVIHGGVAVQLYPRVRIVEVKPSELDTVRRLGVNWQTIWSAGIMCLLNLGFVALALLAASSMVPPPSPAKIGGSARSRS